MPPGETKPENKDLPAQAGVQVPIKALRTYQGDVEETLGKKKISKTTILIAEEERRKNTPPEPLREVDTRQRNRIFVWSGIVLFFLGIMTVSVVYYIKSANQVALVKTSKSIIAFSEEKGIRLVGLTRTNLIGEIVSAKKSLDLPINSVLYLNSINIDGSSVTASDFLILVAPQIPGPLLRSFENKYMLGIYSYGTNEPFIILTTNDFATTYSGMLQWEKNIILDIGPIFGINNTASTTVFSDEAVQNKDLRVLKNTSGKTVLLYSFIDKNTLVITSHENILTSVVGKYIISKQTR